MQQKNVLILGTVTVAALGVAALALRNPDAAASKSADGRLFPALSEHINEVTEVRIEKNGKSATLKREGGKWKLADRGGYPAQFEKVKELAVRIADLEIDEAKTAKKANHSKLGVEWPPAKKEKEGEAGAGEDAEEAGSESALVTFRDAGGKDLAAVVVGKSEWQGSKAKVYARRLSEDQVYLCSPRGTLSVMPDAKSWIEAKFVELQNDRVQSVSIQHADGEEVDIARSVENHTQFAIQNMPPGKSERYAGAANGVAQALGYGLQLEDVRPVTEIDFNQSPLAKTRFRCVDGLELLVELAKFEDKTWVRVSASFTPPPEPPKVETPPAEPAPGGDEIAAAQPGEEKPAGEAEPAGEKAAEEKPAEEKKDIAKEAAELNERLAPWAFEVASYKSDTLAKRMKDLLAEPPAEGGEDGGLGDAMDDLGMEDQAEDHAEGEKAQEEDQQPPSDEEPKEEEDD